MLQCLGTTANANDFGHRRLTLQGQRERTTDQSDTKDSDFFE
jgi:hypothetical protein